MKDLHKLDIGTPYFYLAKISTQNDKRFVLYIAMLLSETQSIKQVNPTATEGGDSEDLNFNFAVSGMGNGQDKAVLKHKRIPFTIPKNAPITEGGDIHEEEEEEDLTAQNNELSKGRIRIKIHQLAPGHTGQEYVFRLPEKVADIEDTNEEIAYNSPYIHVSKREGMETLSIHTLIPLKGYRYDPACQNITAASPTHPLAVEVDLQEDTTHEGTAILPSIHLRPDQLLLGRRSFQIKVRIGHAKVKSRTMNADQL